MHIPPGHALQPLVPCWGISLLRRSGAMGRSAKMRWKLYLPRTRVGPRVVHAAAAAREVTRCCNTARIPCETLTLPKGHASPVHRTVLGGPVLGSRRSGRSMRAETQPRFKEKRAPRMTQKRHGWLTQHSRSLTATSPGRTEQQQQKTLGPSRLVAGRRPELSAVTIRAFCVIRGAAVPLATPWPSALLDHHREPSRAADSGELTCDRSHDRTTVAERRE